MVKGTTKSGIAFELDERIKDDARLTYLLVKIQKTAESASLMDTGRAMNELLDLIFGSDENTFMFMNEVADKHDGVCSTAVMLEELTEMLDALNAKN